jgi:hypothetical protein
MPRYYFHVHDDLDFEDEEGLDLPDVTAARAKAVEGARDLMCATLRDGHLNLDHSIAVADGDHELFRLKFRDVVQLRG